MNLRTFIERPVLSAVISITIVVGYHRAVQSARRTISRYCSADHYGEYHLLWRQCGNFAEECDCSFGRSDQWCGRHDLHDFQRHQCWYSEYHRVLQAGNRPGHGSGQRTEPRVESDGTASGRSNAGRCDYFQTSDKYPADVLAFQSGR